MRFTNKSLAIAVLSIISVTTNSFSISSQSVARSQSTHNTCNPSPSHSIFAQAIEANHHQYCRSPSSTELCVAATSMVNKTTDKQRRGGKFQSDLYHKPVVLVGTSTANNELSKLASSFAATISDGFTIDISEAAQKGKRDAILLDLSTVDDRQASSVTDTIQQYYNQDYLVIYINVQNQNDDVEQILIDNSDYELCIKAEDVKTVHDVVTDGDVTDSDVIDGDVIDAVIVTDTDGNVDADASDDVDDEVHATPWDNMEWQFQRLLARAFLPLAIPGSSEPSVNTAQLTMGDNAFFLSLSFPKISDAEPYIEAMCQDVDAMEFRADLLDCRDDRFELLHSLQKIREMCRSHATRAPMLPLYGEVMDDSLPVVYTVRTANQAGTYPDDKDGIAKMFDILELGLRGGVEVLDIESAWDAVKTGGILSQVEDRYATQILGSHHVVGKKVSDDEAIQINRRCALDGRAHGAKVVLSIEDEKDDQQALRAGEVSKRMASEAGDPIIPHIGLILGDVGKYSRVLNIPFTPVTHESLPFVAAPGQMSASELMAIRLIMDVVPPLKYGILGHNIAYSVSPAMQGAAFAASRLPHSYSLIDMEDVDEFVNSDLWNDEVFGGCSVTIPHKQAIIPHLDQLTDAAQAIGAVNTVIVKKPVGEESKRTLIGDNTDWRGIFNPLDRQLGSSSTSEKVGVALILGGGGTARAAAYAATQLGLEKVYYNRTPSKAQDLAATFGGTVALNTDEEGSDSLGSILDAMNGEARVVISTLPAAAEFELPSWFVDSAKDEERKPIIFDVNYKPFWTKLLHQADGYEFPIVRGSEMLWEQGVGQFELWTGRTAPYKVMKSVVLQNCLPEEDE